MAREVAKQARGAEGRPPPGVLLKPTPTVLSPCRAQASPGKCEEGRGSGTHGRCAWAPVVSMVVGASGGPRASDSGGPQEGEGGCAILKKLGRGRAGRDAAALVHVGVGVLEGRPIGALHGHHLLVGPGLLAAGAAALPSLRLHGVPADAWPSGPPHLPGLPAPGLTGVRRQWPVP